MRRTKRQENSVWISREHRRAGSAARILSCSAADVNRLKNEYDEFIESQHQISIVIKLTDGNHMDALSWHTTPYDIAKRIRFYEHILQFSDRLVS